MNKKTIVLMLTMACFSAMAQTDLPAISKLCEISGYTIFNAPQGIAEYTGTAIITNSTDTNWLLISVSEIKPGPNGPIVRSGNSLWLKGETLLYEGPIRDWYPCPQGVLVEKVEAGHSQLSINGVKVIYQRQDKKKIKWISGPEHSPIVAYIEYRDSIAAILKDNSTVKIKKISPYWGADEDGVIFEKRRSIKSINLQQETRAVFIGDYDECCSSQFGIFWSKLDKGITNIWLNGRLVFADVCDDWGPTSQGLQIIQGKNVLIVNLKIP